MRRWQRSKSPGGLIIGGMGGRIYTAAMGSDTEPISPVRATKITGDASAGYIDVEQWAIARQWINAECTHTGT